MKELAYRPDSFDAVKGQRSVKEFLEQKVRAFKETGEPVSHILLLGPSGTGKTTMANVIAAEMGVQFVSVDAPKIKKTDDLWPLFEPLDENDVLFIDEIHALASPVQEGLYTAMEDFTFSMMVGKGKDRSLETFPIAPFTLIGATTHQGDLNAPLLRRFKTKLNLVPYAYGELVEMAHEQSLRQFGMPLEKEIGEAIARLSRNSPAMVNMLVEEYGKLQASMNTTPTKAFLTIVRWLQLDPFLGLDISQRKYLQILVTENRPVGFDTLVALSGEQKDTVKRLVEPFLCSQVALWGKRGALVERHTKGRVATSLAHEYIRRCRELQAKGWFEGENF